MLLCGALQQPPAPPPALERGIALARQDRLEEAERAFDSIGETDPYYWQAQYFSAVAKAQLKKNEAARAVLERFIARAPDHKDAHYLMGMLLEEAGRFQEAEAHFRKVTTLAPKDARGWSGLGRALQGQGKLQDSIAALHRAEKLAPDDPALPGLLGGLYYRLGRFSEAVRYLLPAWQADSGNVVPATQLAACYAALGDAANLEGLLESLPEGIRPDAAIAAGLVHIGKGEEAAGFTLLVEAAAARPDDFRTQRLVADAMFRSELYQDAQEVYRSCLALQPDDVETMFQLGRSYYEDRKIAEARDLYRRAVEADPAFAAAWFHLGVANRALEKTAEARAALAKALELNPKNPETLYHLGMVALREEEGIPEAERCFMQALAISPAHAGALYEMGRMRISQGRLEEGLTFIDRVLRADPNHTQAHYQRAMALRRLGRAEEAAREFEIFQKLDKEYRERRKILVKKVLAPKNKP